MTIKKPSWFNGWIEPESEASVEHPPKYPYNHATQTESGHLFELDDTPGRERVRLQHRAGTFTEIHSNADEVHKIFGDGYEIVMKNKNVLINGTCNITINGNAVVNIEGDKIERIGGNYIQRIEGDFTQVVEGQTKITSDKDMTIGCNNSTGGLFLRGGLNTSIESDVTVHGKFTASDIYSNSSVTLDVKGGLYVGALGIQSLGGINVGIISSELASVPNTIICDMNIIGTNIVGEATCTSPLGTFALMGSVFAWDTINQLVFNTHTHAVCKCGSTGSSFMKQSGG